MQLLKFWKTSKIFYINFCWFLGYYIQSLLEAAALPLVGVCAWQALVEHIGLSKEKKILIHGGAGGIGSIAIQLAKHRRICGNNCKYK
jgi:NADPH-dependent curcumin reductase CurA